MKTYKNALFIGFNKQKYIKRTSKEHEEESNELKKEN